MTTRHSQIPLHLRVLFVTTVLTAPDARNTMFFKNKFTFRQYLVSNVEIVNDTQAEFIASIGGYYVMAIATVRRVDKNGLIERLTVRPK